MSIEKSRPAGIETAKIISLHTAFTRVTATFTKPDIAGLPFKKCSIMSIAELPARGKMY